MTFSPKPMTVAAASALILAAGPALAQNSVTTDAGTINPAKIERFFNQPGYSPYAGRNYPSRPLWGEIHLHTSWSPDAIAAGTRVGPDEALQYAKGAEITSSTGQKVKLSRPYDFMMVADHSDSLGVMSNVLKRDPNLLADPTLKKWSDGMNAGGAAATAVVMEMITMQGEGTLPEAVTDNDVQFDMWHKMTEIVEGHNDPGRFTALIGYEWTSNFGGGNNLHRNVVYRDGADTAARVTPYTTFDSVDPEDLWKWMENYEDQTGGRVLAIPHNGNLSNGTMFALTNMKGEPLTRAYAESRARWEPLYEVTQIKGDGEAHPALSPTDEFADYETWDRGNLNLIPKKQEMIQYEYAREAFKNGLLMQAKLGANPFKFGLASGTDTHTGLTTAEEDNFFGKHPGVEPGPTRWEHVTLEFQGRKVMGWEMAASGYTAVWATENTREAIWDAMKRRETYSSTGPRMMVRFFGGWEFTDDDAHTREPAWVGYEKGVPMGADLPAGPPGKSPTFLVAAVRDPIGANLDRVQVIKGWLDAGGKTHEKVYDVAWSDDRKPGVDGKLPPVGNTVDVANATWLNTIGAPELLTVWTDPDFDPAESAFYYARVIEIPTPRWTAYEAKRFKVQMPKEVPMITQERAYTSPIWYTPGG